MRQRTDVAGGEGGCFVDLVLNPKIELIRISVPDMRIIVPVHTACEEGRGSGQPSATASREWILRRNQRLALRVGCRAAWLVEVIGDQLTDTRPVAFDVLRHLADRCPIVVDDPCSTANHGAFSGAVREAKVWSNVGVGVVRDETARIDYHMRR